MNDPVMKSVSERFEASKLTQAQLGEKMGYAPTVARQAVSQFLKSGDPHINTLRRFARALGISLATLIRQSGGQWMRKSRRSRLRN